MKIDRLKYDKEIGEFFDIKFDEKGNKVLLKDGKDYNGKLELVFDTGAVQSEGKIEKGLKEGVWKTYYEEKEKKLFRKGKIKIEEFFKEGQREGKYYEYFENGEKSVEIMYRNGKMDGVYLVYHKNGKKKIEGFYKDDLKEGNWYQYDWNERMTDKINYVHNKAEGLAYGYHDNGNIMAIVHYRNGKKNGRFERYTENGQLEEEGKYENDMKEGEWREYRKSSGEIFSKYTMINDKIEGQYKIYYSSGTKLNGFKAVKTPNEEAALNKVWEMENGLKEGKYVHYYPNGQKWEEGQFKNDKEDGVFYSYSEIGNITCEIIYEEGFYTEKKGYFDTNKKILSSCTKHWKEDENEFYERTEHYLNGNLKEKSLVLDDGNYDRQLKLIKYDEAGNVTYHKEYRKRF